MLQAHRIILPYATILLGIAILLAARPAVAQVPVNNNNTLEVGSAGGVYIDADGVIGYREPAAKELEQARARAGHAGDTRDQTLAYVSLPRLFAQAKAAAQAGQAVPEMVRYMQGLTQLHYVFVFPREKDLIIAGPAEEIDAANPLSPVGKRTGRPIMQLDDLVVALRTQMNFQGRQPIGCTIDPASDSLQKSGKVMQDFANATRAVRMEEMRKALGPQKVSVFGASDDTRLALACIAADYKLKRLCLGLDTPPAPGLGSAVDNTRAAASRLWFELDYQPMLVSADGDSFELRGQRLQLKAGEYSFDPKGATEAAKNFARKFTDKVPLIVVNVPMFADLQNIADLSVLAALIQHDKLDARAGWDISSIIDPKGYAVATVPVTHSAQTLVNFSNGSICAGGVMFTTAPWMDKLQRQSDDKNELAPIRARANHTSPSGDAKPSGK